MQPKMNAARQARSRAFTLLEMAIVLVVLGLITAGGVSVLRPTLDGRAAQLTQERMEVVEKALVVHAIRYSCLPCPANGSLPSSNTNAGLSTDSGGAVIALGTCTTATCRLTDAVVPWRQLGLSEQDATDGWGNRMRFAIASNAVASTCAAPTSSLQMTSGMTRTPGTDGCYPVGNLTVDDIDDTDPPEPDMAQAAYVLVSSGPDRAMARQATTGALTPDRFGQIGTDIGQDENRDGDSAFALGAFNSNTSAAHFDDITHYRSASMIIQLCGPGSCGNP